MSSNEFVVQLPMSNQFQLTNVEAQRIMAVLEELSNDLKYAFRLTPSQLATIPDIASVVGQENERNFSMQAELERQFSTLANQLDQPGADGDSDQDGQDVTVGEFYVVARKLRQNTRDICRFLRRSQHLDRRLQPAAAAAGGAPLQARFQQVLESLKAQTRRILSTSVEEDKAEKERFENVSVREKTLTEQERMLTKDLATVKRDREKAVKARDAQAVAEEAAAAIAELEKEGAELKRMSDSAGRTAGSASMQAEAAEHAKSVEGLEQRLQKLQNEMAKMREENATAEKQAKKKSLQQEQKLQDCVEKYDAEMGRLNDEFVMVTEQFITEKARLRRLENHFDSLRLIEGAQAAETMCQVANALEAEAKAKRLADAACLIQSCLRGHKGRGEFAKSKKKGAKGKGKGKGKGKAKKKR